MSAMGEETSEWLPAGFRAAGGAAPAPEPVEFLPEPASRRPGAKPKASGSAVRPRPQRPPSPPRPRPIAPRRAVTSGTKGSGELDLNAASFEDVRALGLTIGEAARFISQRDRRRGLRFVEEVETFYGIPAEVKRKIISRGRV